MALKKKKANVQLFGVHSCLGGCGLHAQEFVQMVTAWLEQPENIIEEGIYRKSGDLASVQKIKSVINKSPKLVKQYLDRKDVPKSENVHIIAGLLKTYLRELPEPLVPYEFYGPAIAAACCLVEHRREMIQRVVELLPPPNKVILKILLHHFEYVTRFQSKNMMTSKNMAVVMAPNLLRPKNESIATLFGDANASYALIETLISNAATYFPKEVPVVIPHHIGHKKARPAVSLINWDGEPGTDSKVSQEAKSDGKAETYSNETEIRHYSQSDDEMSEKEKGRDIKDGSAKVPVLPPTPNPLVPPTAPPQVVVDSEVPVRKTSSAKKLPPIPMRPTPSIPPLSSPPKPTRGPTSPDRYKMNHPGGQLSPKDASPRNHSNRPRDYKKRVKDMLQPKRNKRLQDVLETLKTSSKASLDQVNQEIVTIETELEKLCKFKDEGAGQSTSTQAHVQKEIKRLTDDLSFKKEQSKMIEAHIEEVTKRLTEMKDEEATTEKNPRAIRLSRKFDSNTRPSHETTGDGTLDRENDGIANTEKSHLSKSQPARLDHSLPPKLEATNQIPKAATLSDLPKGPPLQRSRSSNSVSDSNPDTKRSSYPESSEDSASTSTSVSESSSLLPSDFEEAFEAVYGAIVKYSGATLLTESVRRSERGFWLADFPTIDSVMQTWQFGAPMSLDFVNGSPLSLCPEDEDLVTAVSAYDLTKSVVLLMIVHLPQQRTASYWELLPSAK